MIALLTALFMSLAQAQDPRSLDPYAVLGISPGASKEAIKQAYWKAAKQYHPDRYKAQDATSIMAKINLAYEHLNEAGEWPFRASPHPPPRPPVKNGKSAGAQVLQKQRRHFKQRSMQDMLEALRREPYDLNVAIIIEEVFERGGPEDYRQLFALAQLELQSFSPLTRVLLAKAQGRNDQVVLDFLKVASQRNYNSFAAYVRQNGQAVSRAINERLEFPGMQEAAQKMAKTHCGSDVVGTTAARLNSLR